MLVGIISKEDHAKGMVDAFRGAGIDVELLGGDPTSIPGRFDAIVVRNASCSHGASRLAQTVKKEGRFVVCENGATAALRAVVKKLEREAPKKAPPPPPRRSGTALTSLEEVISKGGAFSLRMLTMSPPQIADLLTRIGVVKGKRARQAALDALTHLDTYDRSTVRKTFRKLLGASKSPSGIVFFHNMLWEETGLGVDVLSMEVLSDDALKILAETLDLRLVQPEPKEGEPMPEPVQDEFEGVSEELEEAEPIEEAVSEPEEEGDAEPEVALPPQEDMATPESTEEREIPWPDTIKTANFTAAPNKTATKKMTDEGVSCSWSIRSRSPSEYLLSKQGTAAEVRRLLASMEEQQSAAPRKESKDPFDEMRVLLGMVREQFRLLGLSTLTVRMTEDDTQVDFKRVIVESGSLDLS